MLCRAKNFCKDNEFECGLYGKCIPNVNRHGKAAQNCDGTVDCELGEDESEEVCGKSESRSLTYVTVIVASLCLLLAFPASIYVWKKMKNRIRDLTTAEVEEFFDGTEGGPPINHNSAESACRAKYDTKYNISLNDIIFPPDKKPIGIGNSAKVYKGIVRNHPKGNVCAIKVQDETTGAEETKALLKELKIMIYVGFHKHIVEFIGAYTERIKERILYIVVEYCEHGSLENFLRKYARQYNDMFDVRLLTELSPGYVAAEALQTLDVDVHIFSTADMVRWAAEIAEGMTFLASKKVVHGDLATRNVLLGANYVAKICDFGLSVHLYKPANYVIANECEIPWPWMAIETLSQSKFSIKSDVWSYGITIWEMFSMGAVPYAGRELCAKFLKQLAETGPILDKPIYANREMYERIRTCWAINPNDRPDFESLKKFYTDTLEKLELLGSNVLVHKF